MLAAAEERPAVRDAAEMPPRCRRSVAEMPPKCRRDAAEVSPGCGPRWLLVGVEAEQLRLVGRRMQVHLPVAPARRQPLRRPQQPPAEPLACSQLEL